MLSPTHRVVTADDFKATVRAGKRGVDEHLVSYTRVTNPDASGRFGFIVTKAVGGAVVRNRVRRRLRAASAALLTDRKLSGVDIVVRALPGSAELSWHSLKAEFERTVTKGAGR